MKSSKLKIVLALLAGAILVFSGCQPTVDPVVLSTDANLATLTLTGATLSPVFSADVITYASEVPYATASVVVAATAAQSAATVKINGEVSASKTIALTAGANTITVLVTAEDASTKTYTLTVTRIAVGAVSNLTSLIVTGATLSPVFAEATTSYTATVPYTTTSVTIAAVAANATSTITGTGVQTLTVGSNTLNVVVTAEDTVTITTYAIVITRTAVSANAALGSLEVSAGQLTPAFSPNITNYQLGVIQGTASVTIDAQPSSQFATQTIAGFDSLSHVSTLDSDTTAISIVVTAQSGATKTYTVTIKRAVAATVPVNFLVVESINGTVVGGVDIDIYQVNPDSTVFLSTITTNASGVATANLTPEIKYDFISSKATHAENTYEDFYVDPLGNSVTLVNQKLGMINHLAVSPSIYGVSLSHQGNLQDAVAYDGTTPIDTTGTTYLLVTFLGREAVAKTAWSGFGAKLDFNRTPTTFNGIEGMANGEPECVPIPALGINMWTADFVFDLTGMEMPAGVQNMCIVGYDVANNRVETSLPASFVNNPAGVDISAGVFSDMLMDIRTYPVSRGYFGKGRTDLMALTQFEGNDITYRTNLSFNFLDAADADIPILGFDVYRSTDGTTFEKVGSQLYGALTGGNHSYFDTDSKLVQDNGTTVYHYKVVAFTDAVNSKESGVVQAYISTPFGANLATPANRAILSAASPIDYSFEISDTNLWNAAKSDYFYFILTIREKSGAYKYVGQFRYNFTTSTFQWLYYGDGYYDLADSGGALLANDISYAAGTITISSYVTDFAPTNVWTGKAMTYSAANTYQWDIVGDLDDLNGSDGPCWFEKATTGGVTKSFGNGYSEGSNAINGRFEFSVIE